MDSLPPILNTPPPPPPPGPPPAPPPPDRLKRHGCLTAWLLFMLFAEAMSILGELGLKAITSAVNSPALAQIATEPMWYTWGVAILSLVDIFCVMFLFKWKKWAFYGSAGVGVGVMVLTLAEHGSLGGAISPLVMPIVLYFVLQIGGQNSGWRRLR